MEVIREQEGLVTEIFIPPEFVFVEDKPRDYTGELIIIQDASVSEVGFTLYLWYKACHNEWHYTTVPYLSLV